MQEFENSLRGGCRTYSLGRLVDCSAANAGRMRLVWGRLWAVTAPHLVAACCARDDDVALLAAGQLAGLAAQLLGRSELSHFAHQVPPPPRIHISSPTSYCMVWW